MKIGAAYIRNSDIRSTSEDVQLLKIRELFDKRGIILPDEYVFCDHGIGGMGTRRRKDYQAMLKLAEAGAFSYVGLYDLHRGSRDVVDWFTFRKNMKQVGVEVVAVLDELGDIDNPNDYLQELFKIGFGSHHVLTSRYKSMEKIDLLAQQGLFCGGYPPFGYDVVDQKYVVNSYEADLVRKIFAMYAAGASYKDILAELPPGIKGKRGKPMGTNALHYLLKNERYIGRYTWNKRKVKYMGDWAGGAPSDRAVVIEGLIPAIVDTETWEAVKKRMESNKQNKANHNRKDRVYLLSGIIRCGHCNGAFAGMTSVNKKGFEYKSYRCATKARNKTCKAHNIPAADIEPLVVSLLRGSVLDGTMIEATADAILAAGAKRNGPGDTEFVKKEISQVEAGISNLVKAVSGGLGDIDAVHDELRALQTKKKLLEQKQAAMQPKARVSREYLIQELSKDIAALKNNPEYIKDLIKKYIIEIKVFDDAIEIYSTADLTMRMVVPEDWTVITKETANLAVGGKQAVNENHPGENSGVATTIGCGGRI